MGSPISWIQFLTNFVYLRAHHTSYIFTSSLYSGGQRSLSLSKAVGVVCMTNWRLASALLNSRQTLRYVNFKVLRTDKLSRFYFGSVLSPCHHMELVCLSHNHLKKMQNDPHGSLSEPGINDSIWQSFPTLLSLGCCSTAVSVLTTHPALPLPFWKGWAPLQGRVAQYVFLNWV